LLPAIFVSDNSETGLGKKGLRTRPGESGDVLTGTGIMDPLLRGPWDGESFQFHHLSSCGFGLMVEAK
jgi:hypothetical protein